MRRSAPESRNANRFHESPAHASYESLVDHRQPPAVCSPPRCPHALAPTPGQPNTGVKLQGSDMLGLVSFNPLLGDTEFPTAVNGDGMVRTRWMESDATLRSWR